MNLFLVLSLALSQIYVAKMAIGFIHKIPVKIPPAQHPTYITKEQWKSINRILTSSNINPLPPKQETQLRNIIYRYYENWAYYKTVQFKRLHKHKCHAIPLEELAMYSRKALYQATRKYNGNSKFVAYAQTYILGELYRGMTELHPITNIPKYIRRKKTHQSMNQTTRYKKQLNTKFMGENGWMIDKISSKYSTTPSSTDILTRYLEIEQSQEGYQKIIQQVAELDQMTQDIFYMKYGSILENNGKEKSNREIGEHIGYSEEYVRKRIEIIRKKIRPPFSSMNLSDLL